MFSTFEWKPMNPRERIRLPQRFITMFVQSDRNWCTIYSCARCSKYLLYATDELRWIKNISPYSVKKNFLRRSNQSGGNWWFLISTLNIVLQFVLVCLQSGRSQWSWHYRLLHFVIFNLASTFSFSLKLIVSFIRELLKGWKYRTDVNRWKFFPAPEFTYSFLCSELATQGAGNWTLCSSWSSIVFFSCTKDVILAFFEISSDSDEN